MSPDPVTFDATTGEDVLRAARAAVAESCRVQDAVVAAHADGQAATFASVVEPLAQVENERLSAQRLLAMYELSADEALRDAWDEASGIFAEHSLATAQNDALFGLVEAVHRSYAGSQDDDPDHEERRRLLNCMRWDFVGKGATLPSGSPERARFAAIQRRFEDVRNEMKRNLSEPARGGKPELWLRPDELEGVDADVYAPWPRRDDGHISVQKPGPVVTSATRSDVRRRAYRLSKLQVCRPANEALFQEAAVLRDEGARLLGFDHHAQLILEGSTERMDGTTVADTNRFVDDLVAKVRPLGQAEVARLTAAKKADKKADGHSDEPLRPWDVDYYRAQMAASTVAKDVRDLFPVDTAIDGMLRLCALLFGLRFDEETGASTANRQVWHDDVRMFRVWDEDALGGAFVGHLYLDLYLRPGKYAGSMFNTGMRPGYLLADGHRRSFPSAALVWSIDKPPPADPKPARFSLEGLVHLLHELGHGIHELVSRTRYARFHGASGTVIDFGEAPSQMLENWCYQPEVLRFLAAGPSSTGGQIPDAIAAFPFEEAVRQQRSNRGPLFHLNQLVISAFDLDVFQPASHAAARALDIGGVYWQKRRDIYPLAECADEVEANPLYTRLVNLLSPDYGAGFYCYYLANMYAADMFDTHFRTQPLSRDAGRAYRRAVLEKGGRQDGRAIFRAYLGRDVRMDGLAAQLGLE